MATDFVQSVLLVVLGAGTTLAGTSLTEWLRGRRESTRAREQRDAAREDLVREQGREHLRIVHDSLAELVEIGGEQARGIYDRIAAIEPHLTLLRKQYLLVPDVTVRRSLSDGLMLLTNRESRAVSWPDWSKAAADSAFVVAASLRGEEPNAGYVASLIRLRDKYLINGK